ncbi:MAG: substrate-binding domain-containing protein [Planctomycetaceae bacterium]
MMLRALDRFTPLHALTAGAILLMLFIGGCSEAQKGEKSGEAGKAKSETITIAMLPKLKNIAYFDACHAGAKSAAEELGVTLIYDGPSQPSGSEQNQFIETWTRRGVDAICVAPNQPQTIKRFVEKAQERGIKVLTWDSDAPESGRSLMVNQVDDQKLGEMLMDEIARQAKEEGEWAVVIASLDAANLNSWRKFAEARAAEKYPKMTKVDTVVTDEDENKARQSVETLLNKYPNLKGIIAFDSNSVPGAAEALKRTGRAGKVALTGNTTPGKMKNYIKDGVLESFFLWDPRALGDLTIRLAKGVVEGKEIQAGAAVNGSKPVVFSAKDPTMVILSDPIRFTKENIDQYDWGF